MDDDPDTMILRRFSEEPEFERAVQMDLEDPLGRFRERFVMSDPDLIYLDGNSLGRLPKDSVDHLAEVVRREWGERLIRSWNEGWWELQVRLGELLAPLVGASAGEVIISDSTSLNLFKLGHAAVVARPGRNRIVTDDLNFPTDLYVLDSIAEIVDGEVEVIASDGINGPVEEILAAIDESTALVALSHTVFKSGYTYDLEDITSAAHEKGALVLWDTSHSVGVVPIDFGAAEVDLAVGCTYKYLNGGPGSPAFLYVREDLQDVLHNPVSAWWAHEDPFSFDLDFRPTAGIRRFHTGTMPILSLAGAEVGITDVVEAGIHAIRAKSISLGEFFIQLFDGVLRPLGFELRSPLDAHRRGAHLSLSHPHAWPLTRALIERAMVIPDFRAPDNLRVGLSPLYTSFVDVHTAVHRMREVIESGLYREFADASFEVT